MQVDVCLHPGEGYYTFQAYQTCLFYSEEKDISTGNKTWISTLDAQFFLMLITIFFKYMGEVGAGDMELEVRFSDNLFMTLKLPLIVMLLESTSLKNGL